MSSILGNDNFQGGLEDIAAEWSGEWVYTMSVNGSRGLFPEGIVFEDERSAVLFLLRWS